MQGFWVEASNNMGDTVKAGDHLYVTKTPLNRGDLALCVGDGSPYICRVEDEVPADAYKINKILKDKDQLSATEIRQTFLDLDSLV